MKSFGLIVFCLLTMVSCTTTKRLSKFTREKLSSLENNANEKLPDYITISIDSSLNKNGLFEVKKLRSFFIPAIIYWQKENNLSCNLNPKIPVKQFEQELIKFADSNQLGEKINGRKISLTIVEIPNSFVLTQKGMVLFLFVGYIVSELESIYAIKKDLKVKYNIVENGKEVKSGVIVIPNQEIPLINKLKTTKKFTRRYLDYYTKSCKKLDKLFFEKLLNEL